MNKIFVKVLIISIAIAIFGNISGCSSPVSKEAIVVSQIATSKHYDKTVSVNTQGGNETTAMDSTNISDQELATAITESITRSKLFQKVIQGEKSDYKLNVSTINMSKPVFGLSFTVQIEAAWSLVNVKNNNAVMRETITSTHTTSVGEAFVAATRLKMAVEGAVKENIRLGLTKISQLELN